MIHCENLHWQLHHLIREVFVGFVGGGVIRMENGQSNGCSNRKFENKRWVNSLYWDKPNDRLLWYGPDTRHYLNFGETFL